MWGAIKAWLNSVVHVPGVFVPMVAAVAVVVGGNSVLLVANVNTEPDAALVAIDETLEPTETPTPEATTPPPPPPAAKDTTAPKGADFIIDAPAKPQEYLPPASSGFVYVRPSILNVSANDFPAWISYNASYDNERDGETEETWNSSLYGWYNTKYGQTYQYQPIEAHTHWWGDPATSPSHDAIVNYIANRDALTVNFVVSANRVTDMLPLTWMGTTTGYRNPWAWKMEIDPRLGEQVYKTVGALMYIVERKNARLANESIRLHKEFADTACADIDTLHVREWVNKFASGEYDIATGQPAIVAPSSTPSSSPSTSSPAPNPTDTTNSSPSPSTSSS